MAPVGPRKAAIIRHARSAALYAGDPDAGAYFARMAVQESTAFKNIVDALIVGMKSDHVVGDVNNWTRLDHLHVGFVANIDNRVYCVRKPTAVFDFVGTMGFDPGLGSYGDGVGGHIVFPTLPTAAGNIYSQNSAAIFAHQNGSPETTTSNFYPIGMAGSGGRTRLSARIAGQQESGRINSTSDTTNIRVSTGRTGLRGGFRNDAANEQYSFDTTVGTAMAKASAAPSALKLSFLRNDTSYSPDRIALGGCGGDFTDVRFASLLARMKTALQAAGAY